MFGLLISVAVTIDAKELEVRVKDLLRDKLSINALKNTSQADNVSKLISQSQNSIEEREIYFSAIAKLYVENVVLRSKLDTTLQTGQASTDQLPDLTIAEPVMETKGPKPDTSETFHLVYCAQGRKSYYRDVPRMFQGDLISDHLRGQHG